jgi:hypothetical protein
LLRNAELQVLLVKQHNPDPFGIVPIGHVPVKVGVVQVPPSAVAKLQVKCSAFESRQRLPPVTVDDADAIRMLSDTLAVWPQLVPIKQVENATPVAAAQGTVVPVAPVRLSVFRSLVPR